MKKKQLMMLFSLPLFLSIASKAMALDASPKQPDPFDDPFFQPNQDAFEQMVQMQKMMEQFMRSQYAPMRNNSHYPLKQQGVRGLERVQIKDNQKELIYKITLPKGADSKVDVSIKNDYLVIGANIIQTINREDGSSKAVSYSQSHYNQSFKLPHDCDPDSMVTKMKDSNLIVTFKKKSFKSSLI